MSQTLKCIKHDFNLPNHKNELSKAGDVIERLKYKVNGYVNNVELITDKEFVDLYEHLVRILDYVGNLSSHAFKIEDELEEMYKLQFVQTPELGRQLWLDHLDNVHHPYDTLKNRCFKLLDDWDAYYMALYDKEPPNWNP